MITVSSVANASQGELLCITYELLLDHLEQALQSEQDERKRHIEEAIHIIKMLAEDLNFEYELSHELFRIYVYVQGILLSYKVKNHKIQESHKLIYKLYEGFREIVQKQEKSGPSMKNSQEIYAGMTYGKGYLNEMIIEEENRGFKA